MILALNCGSSSVKFQIFDRGSKESIAKGMVDRIGQVTSKISCSTLKKGDIKVPSKKISSHKEALAVIIDLLCHAEHGVISSPEDIKAVGHRVVHGGDKFSRSQEITKEVLDAIKELQDIAPLHNPPNIAGIEAAKEHFPNVPHIAVFDTAFHQTMPEHSYMYAVPYDWYTKYGVRRYGFHGPSHYYVSRRAIKLLRKKNSKIITLHIGNGVSITAIKDGKSVDTSMGFTPLEGAIMGTRSGDVDPAVLCYIMQKEGRSAKEVENILNKQSGLLGITGDLFDRRDIIQKAKEGDARAKLAIDMEVYRLKKYLGAYAAALGGLDAIVFTAGVGENSPLIREKACAGLVGFGLKLDPAKNKKAVGGVEADISVNRSRIRIYVIPTNEELVFVEEVLKLI